MGDESVFMWKEMFMIFLGATVVSVVWGDYR
jgi:hypothetical protein